MIMLVGTACKTDVTHHSFGIRGRLSSTKSVGLRESKDPTTTRQCTPALVCSPTPTSMLNSVKRPLAVPDFSIDDADHSSLSSADITKDIMDESSQAAGKDLSDLVVLVVANSRNDTVGLVDALKRSFTTNGVWCRSEPTKDVEVHHCGSLEIVDTIPMRSMEGGRNSPKGLARRWISRNGLRRIVLNRRVIVVCVVLCRLVYAKRVFTPECEEWMELFGLMFKPMKEAVRILAKVEDNIDARRSVDFFVEKHGLLRENIIYSSDQNWHDQILHKISIVVPFSMSNDFSEKNWKYIWGSEKVILFGKTGTGKSTLAQMLTLGKLESDPKNTPFVTSPGCRGATEDVIVGDGRGWSVLDTPGFGEPGLGGTIHSEEVAKKIKKYVQKVEGTFAHYLFVVEKGRMDDWDRNIWDFLCKFIGDDIKQNLSIVVSGADEDWVEDEDNRKSLQESFRGFDKDHIVCADFSADDTISPEVSNEERILIEESNKEWQKIRDESLIKLERFLAGRKLTDRHCPRGKVDCREEKFSFQIDLLFDDNQTIKFRNKGTQYLQRVHDFSSRIRRMLFVRDDLHISEKLE